MSETTKPAISNKLKTRKMMGETEFQIFLILLIVLVITDLTMLINLLVR